MRFVGDFHIHSHYSRATSKQLTPDHLDFWARAKGISVVGTGDFTHPGWIAELRERLVPAEEGLFALKEEYRIGTEEHGFGPAVDTAKTRFLLTAEVSSIYKYDGAVRKVHNVIYAPHFDAVLRIQEKIERLGGNIRSDGRPILGLDSRDLLELCLDADEDIFFVPAHIWTPWFSALGSKSGFDSIRECFRDLSGHISAVETGLSSDPPMNWMCSFLDGYTLVSNSDAHSPEKLGREANLFDTELSYSAIVRAMAEGAPAGFRGTVEFFPQEGKYHFDGHRKCGVVWDPLETLRHGGICPVCGQPVTVGVLNRVAQLADRGDINERSNRDPFYSLIPLKEILSEIEGTGVGSKRVQARYAEVLGRLGPELDILLFRERDEIARLYGEALATAVERMRGRQVRVSAGYDGEYGAIHIWSDDDRPPSDDATRLIFDDGAGEPSGERSPGATSAPPPLALVEFDLARYQGLRAEYTPIGATSNGAPAPPATPQPRETSSTRARITTVSPCETQRAPGALLPQASAPQTYSPGVRPAAVGAPELNEEQRAAAAFAGGPSLIIAGPGTGKTRTVVEKIVRLVRSGTAPESIIAVTFANKAASELGERLLAAGVSADSGGAGERALTNERNVRVSTLHSLGLDIVKPRLDLLGRDAGFYILDEDDKAVLLSSEGGITASQRKDLIEYAERVKSGVVAVPEEGQADFPRFRAYQDLLKRRNCFDYDDLVYLPVRLFEKRPQIAEELRRGIRHLIVDEFQDINPTQYALIDALSVGADLCAVGDPNQSIYGFRGASPRFIERFTDDFPGARVFSLSRSYRCPDTVLRASSQVLGAGRAALFGPRTGVTISVFQTPSAASEAEQIARDIEVRAGGVGFFSFDSGVAEVTDSGGTAFSDVAVLCRTSLQMAPLEKAFRDHRIPFRTIRTETIFHTEPYRSFLRFVRFLLRGDHAERGLRGPIDAMRNINPGRLAEASLPATRREAIDLFLRSHDSPPENEKDAATKIEAEISHYWNEDEGAEEFVERARLGSGVDRYDPRIQTVTLMTMHAAKGLEFDVVYVPGCEDTLIPYSLSGRETDVEEERRLLYVAMTRAREDLILTHARKRVIFGQTRIQKESPFLAAIEEELVARRQAEIERREDPSHDQLSLFE